MAAAPRFKVFNAGGEYRAACKFAEDAVCLANLYGAGATVRTGHSKRDIVWTHPGELDSFDAAAEAIHQAIDERNARCAD